ncbi:MAG: hypothetical protein Q9224_006375, partial [Gallowayella concinna]
MGLRVGYVNVQGLSPRGWEVACGLLNTTFDLLFLAETWFVNHARWSRDRRFIAATLNLKQGQYQKGRYKGGIYLLGTAKARGSIHEEVKVDEHTITVTVRQESITAVYFPPSMTSPTLDRQLRNISHSIIILGDINTRFIDSTCSHQRSGPGERVRLFAEHLPITSHRRLQPTLEDWPPGSKIRPNSQLTVDHCYIRNSVRGSRLHLLDNASL